VKKYCHSILLFLYSLNIPEICDIISSVTPLCASVQGVQCLCHQCLYFGIMSSFHSAAVWIPKPVT